MSERTIGFAELWTLAPSRARVLITDDEAPVRDLLARAVSGFGHVTATANSAEAADLQLASGSFDLLLLDIEMSGMSGLEFLPWALKRAPEMPVLMLSGVRDGEVARQALAAGARNYLVKPIDLVFLELAVRDALGVRELLRERNRLAGLG